MDKAEFSAVVAKIGGIERIEHIVTASAGQYSIFANSTNGFNGRYIIIAEEEETLELVDLQTERTIHMPYGDLELVMATSTQAELDAANEIHDRISAERKAILDKMQEEAEQLQKNDFA